MAGALLPGCGVAVMVLALRSWSCDYGVCALEGGVCWDEVGVLIGCCGRGCEAGPPAKMEVFREE